MSAPLAMILTAAVGFAGSFVQSASGFGYAIICMTFWPLLMPFRMASIIEVITAFFMVVYLTVRLRKSISVKLLLPPVIISVIFSFLGVNALLSLSDEVLRRILGAALLALALYFIFLSDRIRLKGSLITGLAAGTISGFFGGLFNIGGPPMVAYYLSVTEDKETYDATLQAYFCCTTISIFLIHMFGGNVTAEMIPYGVSALAGTALGTLLGFVVFRRLTLTGIKRFIYVFMTAAGCYLLLFT